MITNTLKRLVILTMCITIGVWGRIFDTPSPPHPHRSVLSRKKIACPLVYFSLIFKVYLFFINAFNIGLCNSVQRFLNASHSRFKQHKINFSSLQSNCYISDAENAVSAIVSLYRLPIALKLLICTS